MSYYSPTDAERADDDRRRNRATVTDTAKRGTSPAAQYNAEDLAALFSPEELAELETTAATARAAIVARREQEAQAAALMKMTARVLAELKQQQEDELKAQARKIAAERLGVEL